MRCATDEYCNPPKRSPISAKVRPVSCWHSHMATERANAVEPPRALGCVNSSTGSS
jgi:hypothetical protein